MKPIHSDIAKSNVPTRAQLDKVFKLRAEGYTWDRGHSIAACGIILKKGNDFYFFGLNGEIMHNPEALKSTRL